MAINGPGATFQFAEMSFFAKIHPTQRGKILRFVKHSDFIRMYRPDCCTKYDPRNGQFSELFTCPQGAHNWLRILCKVYKTNAKNPFGKYNDSNKKKYPDVILTVDFFGDLAHAVSYATTDDVLYIKGHMNRRWSSFAQEYRDSFTAYQVKIINEETVKSLIKTTVLDRYRESVMNFFYLTRNTPTSRKGSGKLREKLGQNDPRMKRIAREQAQREAKEAQQEALQADDSKYIYQDGDDL